MILMEELQKYQPYHQEKLKNMNILQVKKNYLLIKKKKTIEQAKFTYSLLGKAFEKQIKTIEEPKENQADALKVFKTDTQKLAIKNMIPEDILTEKAKNAPNKTKEIEKHGNQRKFSL